MPHGHEYRYNELKREVRELREVLDSGNNYTIEDWESLFPQEQRDAFAARALIAAEGDAFRAAVRLGFEHPKNNRAEALAVVRRVFLTPGVQALLARDLSEPEEHRKELISRMVRVALYGEDSPAVRAFQMLAKTCGWVKSDVLIQQRQTILTLVTEKNARGQVPAEIHEAIPSFLEHEPGSAVRIDSDSELVDAALGD